MWRNPAFARRSRTVTRVESNRLVGAIESIFRDFDAALGQTHGENSLPGSGLAARMPCGLLSVIETTEPGNMRLNARYGMSAAREECPRSDGAPKWPRRNLNLPLAAGPRVRHIRADGAVAEWLKAAVC